jgi:hypothetical protein
VETCQHDGHSLAAKPDHGDFPPVGSFLRAVMPSSYVYMYIYMSICLYIYKNKTVDHTEAPEPARESRPETVSEVTMALEK